MVSCTQHEYTSSISWLVWPEEKSHCEDSPPEHPIALPKVINLTPTLPSPLPFLTAPQPPSSPNACVSPRPPSPYTPVECASSTTTHCLSLDTYSSMTSKIAGNGAMSPSIEYRLSTAKNTILPSTSDSLPDGASPICLRTSRSEFTSLCLNARR